MMKLVYTLEMPDLVAWYQYHLDHSEALRARRRWFLIAALAIWILAVGVLSTVTQSWGPVIVFAVLTIAWPLFYYFRWSRKVSPKHVKQLCEPHKNPGLLGQFELDLVDEGLISQSKYAELKWRFAGITEIARTPTHGFVLTTTMTGFIIPRQRVTDGDFDAFMNALSEKWQATQK